MRNLTLRSQMRTCHPYALLNCLVIMPKIHIPVQGRSILVSGHRLGGRERLVYLQIRLRSNPEN